MLTLYHCYNARSFRPLWTLEEMGLQYELKMLAIPAAPAGAGLSGGQSARHRAGVVDGRVRMTEVISYMPVSGDALRVRRRCAVEPSEPDYGPFLNWLYFGEATLTFPQTIVLRYSALEPPERRSAQVAADYSQWFLSRLRRIDAVVSQQPTLCAGRFTVADISVGFALMLAQFLGLDAKFSPAVASYWTSLKARDGFRRTVERQKTAAREQNVPEFP